MPDDRQPVDRALLAETIRLFGTAIEYKGQVFNPTEVVVHTNGVTDAHRLSLVWAVVNRWSRPDCAPTTDEATQLLGEIREALTVGSDPLTQEQPRPEVDWSQVTDEEIMEIQAFHDSAQDGL